MTIMFPNIDECRRIIRLKSDDFRQISTLHGFVHFASMLSGWTPNTYKRCLESPMETFMFLRGALGLTSEVDLGFLLKACMESYESDELFHEHEREVLVSGLDDDYRMAIGLQRLLQRLADWGDFADEVN